MTATDCPAQVVDLISLKPFDMETITNSVRKTRKVIIVEECMKTGGIGASLSAVINETLFDELDHQVCASTCSPQTACVPSAACRYATSACNTCMHVFWVMAEGSIPTTCMALLMVLRRHSYVPCPGLHARQPMRQHARKGLSALFAQVIRLSSQDVPTAYAYELEAATIVQPEQVVAAVQRAVSGAAVPA